MPGEKTEPATAKKRRDARKKGDVPMCKDVTTVCSLMAAAIVLWFTFNASVAEVEEFFFYCFSLIESGGIHIISRNGQQIKAEYVSTMINILAVPLLVVLFTSIIVTMIQTKGLITSEKLKPKLSNLDPINGVKKLFSLKSLVEGLKNIVKISLLFCVIIAYYLDKVLNYRAFYYLDPAISAGIFFKDIFWLVVRISAIFGIVAFFDYFYQRWEYERKLRMSKQDIKDEYKQMEGDPKIKGKIKAKQRQLAQARMMDAVPNSDVIVRNPTHYAVALRYRKNVDFAPIILAMGEDELALRIIALGQKHNVPIVENVALARALYAGGKVQQPIPEDLYGLVAKVIIDVFGLKKNQANEVSASHAPNLTNTSEQGTHNGVATPQIPEERRDYPPTNPTSNEEEM